MKRKSIEDQWIRFLQQRFNPKNLPGLFGDDAALLPRSNKNRQQVITIDTLVEGRHFTPETPPFLIGKKLANVSLSDMAAMGAKPLHLLVSLAIPKNKTGGWAKQLYTGIAHALKPYGVLLTGGDTVGSTLTVLSSVGIGETWKKNPVYRTGAKPGHFLYATGFFGKSLETGHHLNFKPRVQEIQWLLKYVPISALTDASDGLARSVELLTTEQNLGAVLHLDQVCLRGNPKETHQAFSHALFDGEDFELVFAAKKINADVLAQFETKFKTPIRAIGTVLRKKSVLFFWKKIRLSFEKKPFDHFA
jgi:thiamine-monophosphate kinase